MAQPEKAFNKGQKHLFYNFGVKMIFLYILSPLYTVAQPEEPIEGVDPPPQ